MPKVVKWSQEHFYLSKNLPRAFCVPLHLAGLASSLNAYGNAFCVRYVSYSCEGDTVPALRGVQSIKGARTKTIYVRSIFEGITS